MPTSKSFISNNIPSSLTTVYTNSSGGPAVLKSINVTGSGTASGTTTTTGANEWSYLGTNMPTFISTAAKTGKGFDIPMPVQLSDNRVLLMWLPNFNHLGGTLDYFTGNRIHTQIVEYTGTVYRAGPIVDVALPTAPYNAATNSLWSAPDGMTTPTFTQPNFRAIALTSTKVVVAYRLGSAFRMLRLTISGNSVSQTTVNFDLTGATAFNNTTAGAFELVTVPGNTNKVVVGGWTSTNWSVQSYNVPDSAAITVGSTLFSTGVAASVFAFSMTNMTKTATSILNYTPSTGTFAAGTTITTSSGGTASVAGVDTGTGRLFLTAATGTFTSTATITGSNGATGIITANALETAIGYLTVGSTAAASASAQMLNFNPTTDTFSLVGTAVVYARTTQIAGIESATLSTGQTANAVVAIIDTGTANAPINFYRQTSITTPLAAGSVTTTQLQHASTKSITTVYKWGDERAVFVGEGSVLVVYDSAGTATNLLPATETTNTGRIYQQWIPFNSRPLYTLYDPATIFVNRVAQYYSRTNITSATSVGGVTLTGNYFPWGHDYGGHYEWSEQANAWMLGQGGRIYSISTSGVVLDEIAIYNLSTVLDYTYAIKELDVSPSGRIHFACELNQRVVPGFDSSVQWTSLGATIRAATTVAVTNSSSLSRTALAATPTALTGTLVANMTNYVDSLGAEKVILIYLNGTTISFSTNALGTWGAGANTSVVCTSNGAQSYGHRINIKLIQETPASAANTDGLWRLVGSRGLDSTTNINNLGISAATTPAGLTAANSATNAIGAGTSPGYGIVAKQSTRIATVSMYDAARSSIRLFASVDGRLANTYGWTPPTTNANLNFPTLAVSKYCYFAGASNGTTSAQTAVGYLFNFIPSADPINTVTTTSGNGWFTATGVDRLSLQVFGTGVDTILTAPGPDNSVRLSVVLQDISGGTSFSVINNQALSSASTTSFRTNETYIIPNNWALRLQAEAAASLNAFVVVVEEN
jgi:hypothetical protein